jgi:preprotein translocase subunit SecA
VRISQEIVSFLNKGRIPMAEEAPQVREAQLPQSDAKKLTTGREEVSGGGRQVAPGGKGSQPIRVEKKVGRNDPCPCGSGKKYKNCHGRMSAE